MLLFFLLLVIALLIVLYYDYKIIEGHRLQVYKGAQVIVDTLDSALDESSNIIKDVMSSKNEACGTKQQQLVRTIESSNWVRSVSIVYDGHMVCSSFFDINNENDANIKHYTRNQLNLSFTRFLAIPKPLISYHIKEGNWVVFTNMFATTLFKEAPFDQFLNNIYIAIGDEWIGSSGQILSKKNINPEEWIFFKSKKYPFSVAVNYAAIQEKHNTVWPTITIVSIVFILGMLVILYMVLTAPQRALLRAVKRNEFIPYYQLISSSDSVRWTGIEVLARWQHPKRGLVSPIEFIELAERTKLIIPMTKRIIDRVAKDIAPHISQLPHSFFISFNISAGHLEDKKLLNNCKTFIAAFPPNTIRIVLELTENQFLDSKKVVRLLKEFQDIGIRIAIDDFGTGYSNLAYLNQYHINHLKIDKTFVSKITSADESCYLVDTIINLAKSMDMHIIAEGVETEAQLRYLRERGVEYIQGFLFHKPSNIDDMMAVLLTRNKR